MVLSSLLFTSAALFGFFAIRACFHLKWAQRLPGPGPTPAKTLQRCSIIIAARDEEERLPGTLDHILAQEGVDFEVVIVDDRSSDKTPEILKRVAAADARVKHLRVDNLPENWLGKCYACHLGSQLATGDWLLFTDADCWLKPNVLARALRVAESEGVDHVTLTPGIAAKTLAARSCHVAFLLSALDWIARVNQDVPDGHLGVGAFNLVRTDLYRKFGGHERLRLCVVDDIKLGLLLRRAGGRTRAFIGAGDALCHWGVTVPHFVKIMEKNYFAALDYRVWLGVLVGVLLPLLWLGAFVGPLTGRVSGECALAGILLMILPATALFRRLEWPVREVLFVPLIFPVLYWAVLNSMVRTLVQGGIRWRNTFYPLRLLREGNVR